VEDLFKSLGLKDFLEYQKTDKKVYHPKKQ
jgi:hypothetical protein